MPSARLRHLLRLAALHAVAAPAVVGLGLAACGGTVTSSGPNELDGSTTPREDGASPADASAIPDTAWIPDGTFDAREPDGACGLPGPIGSCIDVRVSCIPDGLVLGQNSPCGPCWGGVTGLNSCIVSGEDGGDYSITCLCGGGRFPVGLALVAPTGGSGDAVGEFLARSAALEASAVRAFEQLAREVAAHGAPADLVKRLRRAARQEVRHARLLGRAAVARGARVPRIRARRAPVHARSLFALALENAVEGCGREAIGAALLHVQTMRSEDAHLRAILAELADDECAHAELSFDLAAWFASRLDAADVARLAAARRAFFASCKEAPPGGEAAVVRALGLPGREGWRRLVGAVEEGTRAAA